MYNNTDSSLPSPHKKCALIPNSALRIPKFFKLKTQNLKLKTIFLLLLSAPVIAQPAPSGSGYTREITLYGLDYNDKWINVGRYFDTYDANNNLTEYIWQEWRLSDWNNLTKIKYSYNQNNKLIERIICYWTNPGLGDGRWNEYSRELNIYIADTLRESLFQKGSADNIWIDYGRGIFSYNTYNSTGEKLRQNFNRDSLSWHTTGKNVFAFDQSFNKTEDQEYYWYESEWKLFFTEYYSYDLNNNLVEYRKYDNIENKPAYLDSSIYDDNNNKLAYIRYRWNDGWSQYYKFVRSYNSSNQLTEEKSYSNVVDYLGRTTYTYDSENKLIEELTFNAQDSLQNKAVYAYKVTGVSEPFSPVTGFSLADSYPNPFNPSAAIEYTIPEPGTVTLKIFDVLGSEIQTLVNEYQTAGTHTAQFTGTGLPSGIYLYKLTAGHHTAVKKMLLLK